MHHTPSADSRQLLVADSFRVRSAANLVPGAPYAVRGFQLHLERFAGSVFAALASVPHSERPDLARFLHDATTTIGEFGEGFPRLELWRTTGGSQNARFSPCPNSNSGYQFQLSLRQLPELRNTIELRSVHENAHGLVRVHPERKGPNIDAYTALNRELQAEALLVNDAGNVIEGVTTAIVWWDDEVGFVSAETRRVCSVAESLVRRIGAGQVDAGHGTPLPGAIHTPISSPIRTANISPAALVQHEVWAVNALHGIRQVTAIDGHPTPLAHTASTRLEGFRGAFDRTWEPLDGACVEKAIAAARAAVPV